MFPLKFESVYGVDFSGAKLAGRNVWVARAVPAHRTRVPFNGHPPSRPVLRLVDLHRLEALAGTADRTPALAHLVGLIGESTAALWAMDFPFGLPIEVMSPRTR